MSEKDKKKIIGVVGACRGAGTTFTASLLAQAIAKKMRVWLFWRQIYAVAIHA